MREELDIFEPFLSLQAVDCFVGSYLFMPYEWHRVKFWTCKLCQSFFMQLCSRFIHPITKDMNDPVSEAFYAELEIVFICCQTQIWWKISWAALTMFVQGWGNVAGGFRNSESIFQCPPHNSPEVSRGSPFFPHFSHFGTWTKHVNIIPLDHRCIAASHGRWHRWHRWHLPGPVLQGSLLPRCLAQGSPGGRPGPGSPGSWWGLQVGRGPGDLRGEDFCD